MGIGRIWSSLKITKKIMVGLLLSVIPMLLIVVITYTNTSSSYRQNSSSVIRLLLGNHANEINMDLKNAGTVFNNWTKEDIYGMSIEFETIEEIRSNFLTMLDETPVFGLLILAGKDGKIFASAASKNLRESKSVKLAGKLIKNVNGLATDKKTLRVTTNHYLAEFGQLFPKTVEFVYPTKNSEGKHNGFLVAVLDWTSFQEKMGRFIEHFYGLGYKNAYSMLGEMGQPNNIYHSNKDLIGKPFSISDDLEQWINAENDKEVGLFEIAEKDSFFVYNRIVDNDSVLSNPLNVSSSKLYVNIIVPEDDVLVFVQNLLFISVIITLVGVVVIFLISFLIGRQISKPMVKAVDMMDQLGEGNFDSRLAIAGTDEVAQMSKAMNEFAEILKLAISNINGVLTSMANGDLHQKVEVELKGELDTLKDGVNSTVDILSQMIGEVSLSSGNIDTSSRELAETSQNLADGTSKQAATLEEVSASLNEISNQSKTNSESAGQAQIITNETSDSVEKGNERMQGMLKSIKSIEETSANVAKIIKVIDEIAFQTNLLALNAAVEAARAGKYGKGFAVVAEEVRNLASRSADAAKNTTELIETSVKEIKIGVQGADETASVLTEVYGGVVKIRDLIAEIATASNEQAVSVSEINKGLTDVNDIVQQNSAISEETAASSSVLLSQAEGLKNMLSRFSAGQQQSPVEQTPEIVTAGIPGEKNLTTLQPPNELSDAPVRKSIGPKQITLDDDEFGKY